MSESLLEKYPRLKTLLEKKNGQKNKEMSAGTPPPSHVTAETLWADAVEADCADWLTFTIKEPGTSQQEGELKEWLKKHKPSEVDRSDGVGWISVDFG